MKPARRPVGPPEAAARRLLADAGCLWLPTFYNTRILSDAVPSRRTPVGNAQVVLAKDLALIEVDDEEAGLSYYEDLTQDIDTLKWLSRRGPRTLVRLPDGAAGVRHGAKILTGLEILTDRVMAPGSTVDDVYVEVTALRSIATVTFDFAEALAELAPVPATATRGRRFVVKPARWSPAARRARARGRSSGSAPDLPGQGPSAEALALRDTWLAESRRTERYKAQYKLALQMQRYGEDFDSFVALVVSNPVGANLKGHGVPTTRLRRTWDKAGQEVRATAPAPVWQPGEARAEHGRPAEAGMWLAHVEDQVSVLWPDNQARQTRVLELAVLHASWIARYGLVYHLSHDLMQAYLDITSNSQLTKYLDAMQEHSLLRARPELRDRPEKAMYWEPLIASKPVPDDPSTWVSSTPPTPDLRFLDDEEIDWLLNYATKREAEALAARRRNARSERTDSIRRRLASAQDEPPAVSE